ncbi:MAG: non-ribosomal peptide synthetase [Acidimicrobiales bacterium]|jgi:amino acid adenylation domain-containing protein
MGATESRRVDQLVAEQARRFPERLAVSSAAGEVTYAELDRAAGLLADRLAELGVHAGSLVALAAPRSVALAVGALGILRSGAAYVALDPGYPAERLAFMLRDSGADVIVESSSDGLVAKVRSLGRDRPADRDRSDALDLRWDGAPAYVIYTSGSTGLPKGVVVSHESLSNLVSWHIRQFGVTAEDRASLIASPGFDASVWELWPYLVAGASLHVPSDDVRVDAALLRDWITQQHLTVSFVPTALAERLIDLPWPSDAALHYLLTGGDVLKRTPPAGLGFVLVNNYGVTEGTVVSTSCVVAPSETPGLVPPIGFPVAGSKLHVVDEKLVEVSEGEPGELLIGGPQVALGYLGRPKLTSERFLMDHITFWQPGRLYRTGDLVRVRADGQLEFLGRLDDQVKIRGARVECMEVTAALLRHPGVTDCTVTVSTDGTGEQQLIAYLVGSGEGTVGPAELRSHLATFLPDYMSPAAFVWLATLPVTANGKIDREALPAPGEVRGSRDDLAAPRNHLESVIGEVVASLLALPRLGVDEDFFLLGGHSLFAAQLIANLADIFGVDVSLRAVFEGPSVAELAAEVERLVLDQVEGISEVEAEELVSRFSAEA